MLRIALSKLEVIYSLRVLMFVLFPVGAIASIYLNPQHATTAVLAALLLLIILIIYLFMFRPVELPLIIAIVPNTAGPFLANWYVAATFPDGDQFLTQGGDVLVALAFFWAGYLSVVIYLLSKPRFINVVRNLFDVVLEKIGWVLVLALLAIAAFNPGPDFATRSFYEGPEIMNGHHAPSLTWLTIGRFLVSLYGVLVATAPRHD